MPADLLLSFGDFARKNGLSDSLVFLFDLYTQGWDIAKVPAVMALVVANQELMGNLLSNSFVGTHDTNDLYRAAAEVLGDRVLFNAYVQRVRRSSSASGGVTVEVSMPDGGLRTVHAKKLLMTGSPVLHNLRGWDLTAEERDLFSRFRGFGYFAGVVSNPGLPDGVTYSKRGERHRRLPHRGPAGHLPARGHEPAQQDASGLVLYGPGRGPPPGRADVPRRHRRAGGPAWGTGATRRNSWPGIPMARTTSVCLPRILPGASTRGCTAFRVSATRGGPARLSRPRIRPRSGPIRRLCLMHWPLNKVVRHNLGVGGRTTTCGEGMPYLSDRRTHVTYL